MTRFFNTTGPCNPDDHYMLPPEERLIGAQLHRYIRDKLYWVLHAPRQTGKTTFLLDWMRKINAGGEGLACYVSVEDCQRVTDVSEAMRIINFNIRTALSEMGYKPPTARETDPLNMVSATLRQIAGLVAPKPLVILFDETDVLEGDPLIRFLRLLRGGFATRGVGIFPTSIALVGMRDLKDYITASKDGFAPNPGSPFNIKEDSAVIGNFTKENVARLFAQRTEETGQGITEEALKYVWQQSQGQPWIVNNLFKRATMRVLPAGSAETVTLAHIEQAREQMINARETHLDALAHRLEDPRVRQVMETMMTGEADMRLAQGEGFRLCLDLGLVETRRGVAQVANPIYREILAREMTYGAQLAIAEPTWPWKKPDGSLDMDRLLREFQKFWQRHSQVWEERSDYTEAFPHLLLMAFLQRVLNGGGSIEREYAAGRGRMDLMVQYADECFIIEIKLIHPYDNPETVREEGLEQIRQYRDKIAPSSPAWLVIFDRRPQAKRKTWEERIGWQRQDEIAIVQC
ncbi:MAG: PD-(D/E)XK nuclease domain-containing protein [Desulfobulbaceae bacterium]|nr:PD-(D/E)XK nuclease domain-containing protein [Desulfobulbaceae bacterium]